MIDVKAAFSSAYEYLQVVQDMIGGELEDLRLEEVELSDDAPSCILSHGVLR